jgi:hypothetical protein
MGLLEIRPMPDGRRLVQVEAFDRAIERSRDARRKQKVNVQKPVDEDAAPARGEDPDVEAPIFAHAQARKMAFSAEREKLKLGIEKKTLLPIDDVSRAMTGWSGSLVNILEVVPYRADEIAAAASKDGVRGVRAVLKRVIRDLRCQMSAEMLRIAGEIGVTPQMTGDDDL